MQKAPPRTSADAAPASSAAAPALTSELMTEAGFRHAFFYRAGGVSVGACRSLNFSYAVGDEAANVDENLRRAAQTLGVPANRMYFLAQVHAAGVVELSGDEPQREILFTEGDALVSGAPDVACGVRTADCVPILLSDQATGRVAAVHAGWRGAVARVVEHAAARLGGAPENWLACVGPHISAARFEVSEDVAAKIVEVSSSACLSRPTGTKPHIDLRAVIKLQLQAAGLKAAQIDDVRGCTRSDAERFFSYRRDGRLSGRHLAAIVPRN